MNKKIIINKPVRATKILAIINIKLNNIKLMDILLFLIKYAKTIQYKVAALKERFEKPETEIPECLIHAVSYIYLNCLGVIFINECKYVLNSLKTENTMIIRKLINNAIIINLTKS